MKRVPNLTGWIVFFVLASGLSYLIWVLLRHNYDWNAIRPYWKNLLSGWSVTLGISAVALILSILFGVLLTIGQLSAFAPSRILSRLYVEFVRGTPLLTLILIGYYVVANALNWDNKITFGIAVLSLFAGTYLAEIFRAGVETVSKSQWLSAKAIGLSPAQTYRHIVLPQAIRRVLPASAGQFANLIKDSSLLYVIAVPEFTVQVRQANSNALTSFEGFIPLAAGYLALTLPIFFLSRHLEKRFGFEQ
ncbi:MAG: amino acid ABC transporter permease [Verrucomicrobiales bacterium]|nr:amino acid ABC transporter permease [Verrucomicrobiales bacterium]